MRCSRRGRQPTALRRHVPHCHCPRRWRGRQRGCAPPAAQTDYHCHCCCHSCCHCYRHCCCRYRGRCCCCCGHSCCNRSWRDCARGRCRWPRRRRRVTCTPTETPGTAPARRPTVPRRRGAAAAARERPCALPLSHHCLCSRCRRAARRGRGRCLRCGPGCTSGCRRWRCAARRRRATARR